MRLFAIQLDTVWENKPASFERARNLIARAAPPPNSLVVLPEMFASGFSMNVEAAADGPERATEAFLASLARLHRVFILGGVACRMNDGRGANEAVAIGPDGAERGRYRKLHPFAPMGEHRHYAAGSDLAFFPWEGFSVAPLICYDLRFPEAFRAAVKGGATLLCVIANWPAVRHEHWKVLLQARAIENQCFVAGVNRCGSDPAHSYKGGSVILGPRGETIVEAGAEECFISAETMPHAVHAWRSEFHALGDIRSDGL